MSEIPEPSPPPHDDDLQFTTVEPVAAADQAAQGPACVACHRPIASTYYAVGDKLVCPDCRDRNAAALGGGSRFGRLSRATVFGIIAGVIGAAIWFAVRRTTGKEFGLIALVVGLLVGVAVRAGSHGRGGRGYQILAVALTYCAIAANYMPDIFEAMYRQYQQNHSAAAQNAGPSETSPSGMPSSKSPQPLTGTGRDSKPVGPAMAVLLLILLVVIVFGLALAAPFFAGIHNLVGLFIIGFALWEAWKINARRPVAFAGPYSLGTGTPGAPAVSGRRP